MEWQPIETAPTNAKDLLMYEDGFYYIGYCLGGYWHTDVGTFKPTHWMPLPEPPDGKA